METKEIKINVPEGYEIDKENSTFECIKFKPIKKYITYDKISEKLFKGYYASRIDNSGDIEISVVNDTYNSPINAPFVGKQLAKLLALNQLMNIATYYNELHTIDTGRTTIEYSRIDEIYYTSRISTSFIRGISAIFNRKEDAQAVINNPNFRDILDTLYK